MTDFLTFGANEIDPINAFVDLFSVKDATLELLDPDPEQIFVILLDLQSSRLIARQPLVLILRASFI
jgi:hypothetical protein